MTREQLDTIKAKPHGPDVSALIAEVERLWARERELARDRHMLRQHPEVEFPEGSGLAEWHAFREDTPVRSRDISKLLRVETPRDYFDRKGEAHDAKI